MPTPCYISIEGKTQGNITAGMPPLEKPVCIPCLLRAMAQGNSLVKGE